MVVLLLLPLLGALMGPVQAEAPTQEYEVALQVVDLEVADAPGRHTGPACPAGRPSRSPSG